MPDILPRLAAIDEFDPGNCRCRRFVAYPPSTWNVQSTGRKVRVAEMAVAGLDWRRVISGHGNNFDSANSMGRCHKALE